MTPKEGSADMEKLKELKVIIGICSIIGTALGGAVAFLISHFATISYVDAKFDPVANELKEIKQDTRWITNALYDLNGRTGPIPASVKERGE